MPGLRGILVTEERAGHMLAINVRALSVWRLYDGAKTMCPSACAMAGPAATYRMVHVAVQRMSMVLAPPSVAMSRSPARIPACASCAADSRRMALSPGCLLGAEKR